MSTPKAEIHRIRPTGVATGEMDTPPGTGDPILVIGNDAIRQTFDPLCLEQSMNARLAPGVDAFVLNPDGHGGYGAPVGSVLVSRSHIYPGPVGVDIKCSMSLLQLDLPASELETRSSRQAVMKAILERIPTGIGASKIPEKRSPIGTDLAKELVTTGASSRVCTALEIPFSWTERCEDSYHFGHLGSSSHLMERLEELIETNQLRSFEQKLQQLGSYGGGNHFGECNVVSLRQNARAARCAEVFGLKNEHVAFLSHCGSRGFGYQLASNQFRILREEFAQKNLPLPGGDRDLVYAELGSVSANNYLDDMALGSNFATVNHLLINRLVLDAFREVFPGTGGELVYFISHNIARKESWRKEKAWIHRKGATRAFPAEHPELRGTKFEHTGHPILLPGNPRDGSVVMVAEPGAYLSEFSVNHGAGRRLGRKAALRTLSQMQVERELDGMDIVTNCDFYPLDEAPDAYKSFSDVVASVEAAGLAVPVADLRARFVIKDGDKNS